MSCGLYYVVKCTVYTFVHICISESVKGVLLLAVHQPSSTKPKLDQVSVTEPEDSLHRTSTVILLLNVYS